MNSSKSKLEIHPKRGLKMDLVTDKWIRGCIGVAVILTSIAIVLLASTPLVYAIRWW